MTAEEIMNILSTTSHEDWIHKEDGLLSDEPDSYTYREDVLLRIQKHPIDFSVKFTREDWAINHSDPAAYKVLYDVYYNNSFIITKTLVAVDGCRAILPMPKRGTTKIPFEDYKFATIVAPDALDEYIGRSGLTVIGAGNC